MNLGDVMVPRDGPFSGYLACGSGIYTHAILVSIDPFVMVSEQGDMLWSCAKQENYVALCQASIEARERAFARYTKEPQKYMPVLANHDVSKPVGFIQVLKDNLQVNLNDPWSKEEIFNAFGNIGFNVLSMVGDKILKFTIHEFSYCAVPAFPERTGKLIDALNKIKDLRRKPMEDVFTWQERTRTIAKDAVDEASKEQAQSLI